MIVVWREGRPCIRCRPGEFAPAPEAERNAQPLLADLRRWGMTYTEIAEALNVDYERVKAWGTRAFSPRGEVYHALERLHAAATKAISDARGQ